MVLSVCEIQCQTIKTNIISLHCWTPANSFWQVLVHLQHKFMQHIIYLVFRPFVCTEPAVLTPRKLTEKSWNTSVAVWTGKHWQKPCTDMIRCWWALRLRKQFYVASNLCNSFIFTYHPKPINLNLFIFVKFDRHQVTAWNRVQPAETEQNNQARLILMETIWKKRSMDTLICCVFFNKCKLWTSWVCPGCVSLLRRVACASVPHGIPR